MWYSSVTFGIISGGLKQCLNAPAAYNKWVLNRPMQAQLCEGLIDMVGLTPSAKYPRKCLRPAEIKKSETLVQRVKDVIEKHFINPFQHDVVPENLYNIVSGRPVEEPIQRDLCSMSAQGQAQVKEFNHRFMKDPQEQVTEKFFDPMKRNKMHTFKSAFQSQKKKDKSGKQIDLVADRNILGILVAKSQEKKAPVDFDKALTYPLSPVPLSLATADGSIRKCSKSMLYQSALDQLRGVDYSSISDVKIYILDLAAVIRCIDPKQCTIRQFADRIFQTVPTQVEVVIIACDTYSGKSIKEEEHKRRGQGERYIINSPDVRIPNDFLTFLSNGENKERIFYLIMQSLNDKRGDLGNKVVYFSWKQDCYEITQDHCEVFPQLSSDHEEADTKITSFLKFVNRRFGVHSKVIVRSPSSDIDIPVIILGTGLDADLQIYLDNGVGNYLDNGFCTTRNGA